ncbi:MAG: hypothetical protein HZB38_17665 [Planctomycetes bacterium]|nr:hypothetical protein [Planctomycetota bacterium]
MDVRRTVLSGLAIVGAFTLAGCLSQDTRTGNQGGGSLITAGAKVVSGNMTNLTADEIQILGDEIASRSTQFTGLEITDEQAEAAADFLSANNLNTVADIQALIANPGNIEIPDSVLALIEAGIVTQ